MALRVHLDRVAGTTTSVVWGITAEGEPCLVITQPQGDGSSGQLVISLSVEEWRNVCCKGIVACEQASEASPGAKRPEPSPLARFVGIDGIPLSVHAKPKGGGDH